MRDSHQVLAAEGTKLTPIYDRESDTLEVYFHPEALAPAEGFGVEIQFQNGPVRENGINGLTNEVLLEGLLLRLRALNQPPFNCRENSLAITHLEEALHWLEHRTKLRQQQGIEGTSTPHTS